MSDIIPAVGYVKDTGTSKGRGVFTARKITAGEIVEACPVIVFKAVWEASPLELQFMVCDWSYYAKQESGLYGVMLGFGSMYNHNNPANLRCHALAGPGIMQFIAARDIAVGEELTINYNETEDGITSTDDAWFQATGITPV